MKREEALRLSREKDLDLIEISPKANPPVAKLMEWSKYKYEISKKRKEARKNKSVEQKEMWFKAFIDKGDLNHKLKKVDEFLTKKHPVKVQIRSVRRSNRNHLKDLMNRILKILGEAVVYDPPKFEGRNFSVIVRPNKKIKNKKSENKKSEPKQKGEKTKPKEKKTKSIKEKSK